MNERYSPDRAGKFAKKELYSPHKKKFEAGLGQPQCEMGVRVLKDVLNDREMDAGALFQALTNRGHNFSRTRVDSIRQQAWAEIQARVPGAEREQERLDYMQSVDTVIQLAGMEI